MSREAISEQIKSILSAVPGMGRVHDSSRFAKEWSKYLALFKVDGHINGWMFSRIRTARQQRIGEVEVAHVFMLRGLYSLDDEGGSEGVFQEIVDAVAEAFDAKEALNDTCETTSPDWGPMANQVGLQVDLVEIRMFGDVLCHYAECRLCAEESVSV